ncbi:MAG TPA: hypothetical protein VFN26_06305 [Candidatus Acidoferrum sp.]|nr:hypothetical protein [Candidatus Acidoferrum sp.]
MRKAVGIIGVALPFALAFGKMLLQGSGLQPSISAYYYTDMRNVFVGSLCAIGVFLLSCKGYDWRDEAAGIAACVFAVGVATELAGVAFPPMTLSIFAPKKLRQVVRGNATDKNCQPQQTPAVPAQGHDSETVKHSDNCHH